MDKNTWLLRYTYHVMKKCPDELISIGEEIGGLPEGWKSGEVEAHPLRFVPAMKIWKDRRKMR